MGPGPGLLDTNQPAGVRVTDDIEDILALQPDCALLRSTPRPGRPGDIAAMSALLMSDEGSYVTGQVISVDGLTTRP